MTMATLVLILALSSLPWIGRCGAIMLHDTEQRHLIIGGHDVPSKHRYPYFVSLDYNNGVVLNGALIAPDIVLTAGHAFPNGGQKVTALIGTYELGSGEEIEISQALRDPEWIASGDSFTHDYMIFQLAGPSSAPLLKINRDASVPAVGQTVIVMGLGWTNVTVWENAEILQEATLTAMSSEDCEKSYDPARGAMYQNKIDDTMICTSGGPHNEKDGCGWDSGGPIIVADDNDDPAGDILIGLVSWGERCADPFFPGVEARVSAGTEWIDAMVCELSVDPPLDFDCDNKTPMPTVRVTSAPAQSPIPIHKAGGGGIGFLIWIIAMACFVLVGVTVLCRLRRPVTDEQKKERTNLTAAVDQQNQVESYDSIHGVELEKS